MDKNTKQAVGAEKPTVSGLLEQTLRAMKPDNQIEFEAAMWFEEIEAKQRVSEQEMEEYYQRKGGMEWSS
jgi:hypothetical protein